MTTKVKRLPKSPAAIEKELILYARKFLHSMGDNITSLNYIKAFTKSDSIDRFIYGSLQYVLGHDEAIIKRDSLEARIKNESQLKVACLFYMYICKLVHKDSLTQSEFMAFRSLLAIALSQDHTFGDLSSDAKVLIALGVPTKVLPTDYVIALAQIGEFDKAASIIMAHISTVKGLNAFASFEEAESYYTTEAEKIIGKLNEQGLYGTHKLELMGLMIMSHKVGCMFDCPIYKVGDLLQKMTPELELQMIETLRQGIKRSIKVLGAINETSGD